MGPQFSDIMRFLIKALIAGVQLSALSLTILGAAALMFDRVYFLLNELVTISRGGLLKTIIVSVMFFIAASFVVLAISALG